MTTAISSTSRDDSETRITGNIVPRRRRLKIQRAPSHDVRLAETWGCQVTTAHNRRMLVGQWVEDVLHAYREANDTEALANLLARIDAATVGQTPAALPDVQYRADAADAAEDVAEALWIRYGSDEALAGWIEKLGQELYCGTELLAQLRAERTRRKDAK